MNESSTDSRYLTVEFALPILAVPPCSVEQIAAILSPDGEALDDGLYQALSEATTQAVTAALLLAEIPPAACPHEFRHAYPLVSDHVSLRINYDFEHAPALGEWIREMAVSEVFLERLYPIVRAAVSDCIARHLADGTLAFRPLTVATVASL